MKKNYSINDLPGFSPWPARLLGIENFGQKLKSRENVRQEFEKEKWGKLLQDCLEGTTDFTIEKTDDLAFDKNIEVLMYCRGEFEKTTLGKAHSKQIEIIYEYINPLLPAAAIVELGAGYGSVILNMAKKFFSNNQKFIAGELTESGVQLINRIAEQEKVALKAYPYDFNTPSLNTLQIPEGAVIYTSYSLHYLPWHTTEIIEKIMEIKPKSVVFFEPCYEHSMENDLFGLLRRKYIEINDYNRNLLQVLTQMEKENKIEIKNIFPVVFGSNPLLSFSAIIWQPVQGT